MLNESRVFLLGEGFDYISKEEASYEHYHLNITNNTTNLVIRFTVYDNVICLMSETKEPQRLDETEDFSYEKNNYKSFLSAYKKAKEWTEEKLNTGIISTFLV